MRVFYPDASDLSAAQRGNSTSSNNNRDPASTPGLTSPVPRKTGGAKPGDSEEQQKCREQGVMKFAKQGKPPVPQTLFPHPKTGKMTYLCGNASTVGFLCPHTKNDCNFVHVHKPQDLPAAHHPPFKSFIETHADLSFAGPGQHCVPPTVFLPVPPPPFILLLLFTLTACCIFSLFCYTPLLEPIFVASAQTLHYMPPLDLRPLAGPLPPVPRRVSFAADEPPL
jgi:hypothetical protein